MMNGLIVQQHQELSEKVEIRMPCSPPSLYVFLSKEKSGLLETLPQPFCLGTKML